VFHMEQSKSNFFSRIFEYLKIFSEKAWHAYDSMVQCLPPPPPQGGGRGILTQFFCIVKRKKSCGVSWRYKPKGSTATKNLL
jgi:hypothetical protein